MEIRSVQIRRRLEKILISVEMEFIPIDPLLIAESTRATLVETIGKLLMMLNTKEKMTQVQQLIGPTARESEKRFSQAMEGIRERKLSGTKFNLKELDLGEL